MRTLEEIFGNENREEFLLKCKLNFKLFAEQVVHEIDGKKIQIKPFHLEWVNFAQTKPRTLIIAFTGSGKTTVLGMLLPLHIMFFNQHKEVLVISNTMKQAIRTLEKTQGIIYGNELLKELIPKKRYFAWSRTEINTSTACKMFSNPFTENVAGVHVDYLLADEVDLYDDLELYNREVASRVVRKKNAKLVAITTWRTERGLAAALKKNPEYYHRVYPAMDKKGKILWREEFSKERLETIRREQGQLAFDRNYLCNPSSQASSIYPMEILIPCFDFNRRFEYSTEGMVFMGCDFAISTGRQAAYSVFIIGDKVKENIVIKHIERFKGLGIESQVNKIREMYNTYKPRSIAVDETTFGAAIRDELIKKGLPVVGYDFQYKNRNRYLINLRKLFEQKKIIIPRNELDILTMKKTDILIAELTRMIETETPSGTKVYKTTGTHDDCVMSLGLLCEEAFSQEPVVVAFERI